MKPKGRAKKAKSDKDSAQEKKLRLHRRLDAATSNKLKLFKAKEQQAKEDRIRQKEMELRQKQAEKEARTRINVVVHFGDLNIVSLFLPINTPHKKLRFELRRRYKRITRAELTFPNGKKEVYKYAHRSKLSINNLTGVDNGKSDSPPTAK